jgi:iron complex transport system ATP-binding protein
MILKASQVGVRRQGRDILKEIDLTLQAGEVVALTGANGAGKSTLLRCLNRLISVTSGFVVLDGKPLEEIPLKKIAKMVAYMPSHQSTGAVNCTVMECVLAGRLPHMDTADNNDLSIVFAILEQLNLLALSERELSNLSSGERQRVLLARALVQEPKLLLLDEPTSALDLRHQLETLERIVEVAKTKDVAVVIAIHDLTLALRYADRIVILSNGRLLADGPPGVLTPDVIHTAYGVEARIVMVEGHTIILPLRCDREASVPVHQTNI